MWAGACHTFTDFDFEHRSWVKDSGWPITLSDLGRHYREAKRYVEISTDVFDERLWADIGMPRPYKPNSQEISTTFSVRSGFLSERGYLDWPGPINFSKYLTSPEARNSGNKVLYNATLTDLKSGNAKSVRYGVVSNANLQRRKIRARAYVLAAGGWENPRIMLCANGGAGIGNETDCVGRYYLAHPHGIPADLICPNKAVSTELSWKFAYHKVGRNRAQPYITWKGDAQRRNQLLSSCIQFAPDFDTNSAVYKAMRLRDQFQQGGLSAVDLSISDLSLLLSEIDDVLVGAFRKWSDRGVNARMLEKIPLIYVQEGTPKRHSRVYLSDDRDKFDLRKIVLDMYFDEQEIKNLYSTFKLFAANSRDLGWGRIQFREQADTNSTEPLRGLQEAAHPSGTTRMSDSAMTGVVDKNLRVHSTRNLFVCGSSVFPTNGWISPTYTIVALAIRLAEHLRSSLE